MPLTAQEIMMEELIPQAEVIAEKKLKKLKNKYESRPDGRGGKYSHCFKSEFFHKAINRLAYSAGLRNYI